NPNRRLLTVACNPNSGCGNYKLYSIPFLQSGPSSPGHNRKDQNLTNVSQARVFVEVTPIEWAVAQLGPDLIREQVLSVSYDTHAKWRKTMVYCLVESRIAWAGMLEPAADSA